MMCINSNTKDAIIEEIAKLDIDASEAQNIAEFLDNLPECLAEDIKRGRKNKRPLSKYNVFMKGCLGGENRKPMADCVHLWKKHKEEKRGS